MAALVFLAADKASQIPFLPYLPDKVVHFFYYGIMAVLLANGAGIAGWGIPMMIAAKLIPGRPGAVVIPLTYRGVATKVVTGRQGARGASAARR